jgi:gamma-glutamylcyclotransferase (GGCT)/AIG2-like uncharacterized protein YtfP
MDASATYLFTYGTLTGDFNNPFAEKLRAHAFYVGKGYFPGSLYLISWFPGAVYNPESGSKVYGEIYRLTSPEIILAELDAYEDVFEDEKASLYLRKQIPVVAQDSLTVNCWVYVYNQPVTDLQLLSDGIFKA